MYVNRVVAFAPCVRAAILVYSTVPSLRVIRYTAPRFGAGEAPSTDALSGALVDADAGCTKDERAGAAGSGCDGSSSFGSQTVASASITAIGHGLEIGTTPCSDGSGLTTGALGACSGVIWITAGLALTSFCTGLDDCIGVEEVRTSEAGTALASSGLAAAGFGDECRGPLTHLQP